MDPTYKINSQFAHYVLLDTHMLQSWKISSGQKKKKKKKKNIYIYIYRKQSKELKELYRICDRQRIQIAVTTLRRQLQSANISHSI